MRVVIIPDVHNNFVTAESIIGRENPDGVVFLGDYFDSFGDTLGMTQQTALWLKESMKMKNRIHLLGNHDLSYRQKKFQCTGFTENKKITIKKSGVDLYGLLDYCWVGDWLCTHAGLSYDFYQRYGNGKSISDFLHTYSTEEQLCDKLYSIGVSRMGDEPFGGIVWCDYSEFRDIRDLKQIFGHTYGLLRETSNHICLDTGLKHYAVYENDVMKTKNVSE